MAAPGAGGEHPSITTLIPLTVNLVLFVGILFYFLRKPVGEFVRGRHNTLKEELESVRAQLKQSQDRYSEFSKRLQSLDAELSALREQSRQDAHAAKTRIIEEARAQSARISQDSRAAASSLITELRSQLYGELSTKVLERAERLLRERLTGDDRARIRQEFSQQVERGQ